MPQTLALLMTQYEEFFVVSINGKELDMMMEEYESDERVSVWLTNVDDTSYKLSKDQFGDTDITILDKELFMKATVDKYEEG